MSKARSTDVGMRGAFCGGGRAHTQGRPSRAGEESAPWVNAAGAGRGERHGKWG